MLTPNLTCIALPLSRECLVEGLLKQLPAQGVELRLSGAARAALRSAAVETPSEWGPLEDPLTGIFGRVVTSMLPDTGLPVVEAVVPETLEPVATFILIRHPTDADFQCFKALIGKG